MPDFSIKRGDTYPAIAVTVKQDGTAVDLSGASVYFFMRAAGETAKTVDSGAVTITAATSGQCEYRWAVGDTATAGDYEGEFEIHLASGRVATAPASGFVCIRIVGDIGNSSTTTPAP